MTTRILTLSGSRGGEPFTLDVPVEQPVKVTLAGAGTLTDSAWDTYTAPQPTGVGPLPVRRTYDAPNQSGVGPLGIPATVSGANCFPDIAAGRISCHTMKPASLATCASGGYDSNLDAFYGSIPDDHEYIGGIWHEPEDEVQAATFTAATWRAANIRAAQRMKDLNKPNLKFSICLRGFRTEFSYGGFAQFWEPAMDSLVDYIFFDPYKDAGAGIPTTYPEYMASSAAFARSKGKPFGVMEWGISQASSDAVRADWILGAWAWQKAQPDFVISCYYPNNISNNYTAYPTSSWPLTHAALQQMATEGQPL